MIIGQRQPNSKTCGQTVVAMVGGITVNESIKLFGHDKKTNLNELIKVLKEKLDIETSELVKVDNRRKYELPNFAIVRIVQRSKNIGHVLVKYKEQWFDPSYDLPFFGKEQVIQHYENFGKVRISHYIEIKGGK